MNGYFSKKSYGCFNIVSSSSLECDFVSEIMSAVVDATLRNSGLAVPASALAGLPSYRDNTFGLGHTMREAQPRLNISAGTSDAGCGCINSDAHANAVHVRDMEATWLNKGVLSSVFYG